ncbi:MAG: DUF2510 domain-containing protein [Ilumatobacteraceae bacterium]|nr:DUF2510 domain-containing protein [Ilumatobacteraceae bacterium]
MQEYSSISVSSYEAGTLADQLTEQSRAGWTVVAIVPTGSSVTAYLSRDADGTGHSNQRDMPVVAATPTPIDTGADSAPADEPADTPSDPVAETPGWAAGVSTTAADEPVSGDDTGDHFTVADEPAAETAPTELGGAAAGAGAAPAGWYADPSSRFELRYWDGTQWTEHVSRAGQQYTDPPVA